jgi:hypothetical protein
LEIAMPALPTPELRFIIRVNPTPGNPRTLRILQQRWIDDDPPDEGAIRYEWRDVPLVEEPANVEG